MVEFDDGDRGKISLPNIRLLPPGYQIQCKSSLCVIPNVPFYLPCIVQPKVNPNNFLPLAK